VAKPLPRHHAKLTNPKDAIGSSKLPLHLVPDSVELYAALAFAEGALKYGAYNWRAAGVRSSIYYAAMKRHQKKWWNGEWADPKTKVPHLASIIACAGIIIDAHEQGMLNDDRPPVANTEKTIADAEAVLANLFVLFKEHNPKHWTIQDQLPKEAANEEAVRSPKRSRRAA
jgi:hypothetical protein